MNALTGNTLRLIHSLIIAQSLLDKTSTRYEMDAVLSKLSQAKFSKQVLVILKGRGLKQLISKRLFPIKERREKRRKVEAQPTTSKTETPSPTKSSQDESKTEDDVL